MPNFGYDEPDHDCAEEAGMGPPGICPRCRRNPFAKDAPPRFAPLPPGFPAMRSRRPIENLEQWEAYERDEERFHREMRPATRRRYTFNQVGHEELKAMGVLSKKKVTKKTDKPRGEDFSWSKPKLKVTTVRYARLYKTEEFENHRFEAEALVPDGVDPQEVLDNLRLWIEAQNDRKPGEDLSIAGVERAFKTLELFATDRMRYSRGFEQCVEMMRELLGVPD